jgi:hypothetical protein
MCAAKVAGEPLVEASFADVLGRLGQGHTLPPTKRIHWACALRKIAAAMGKPVEAVPARWSGIRHAVGRLHHAPVGMKAKTLRNHVSNVKAALAWFRGKTGLPARGAPLSEDWSALYNAIGERLDQKGLRAFLRYCSAAGIEPAAVDEAALDAFLAYRAEHTSLKIGLGARRAVARSWNRCVGTVPGWPQSRLIEPALPSKGLDVDALPAGLRRDLEAYLAHLATVRRNARGRRLRPCKPTTIRTRRAELVAYLTRVIECGFPIASFSSLAEALKPAVVEIVLDHYWHQNGPVPSGYTIDLGWKLLAVAREIGLPAADLAALDDIRHKLEQERRHGLTEKNRGVIRHVLGDGVWVGVVGVPDRLMAEAERRHNQSPVGAAVLAGLAVAIGILITAPIRVGNLAAIRLGENLIRPDGTNGRYWLVFPDHDVKNRVPLQFELTDNTTAMIDRYVKVFRPRLVREAGSLWLFPGEDGRHKGRTTLSKQISERVFKATGLRLTAHQFRHAAAAIYLRHRPGEYELVRRLLGHRSIITTMNFYAGLETLEANRIYGDILEEELKKRRGETGVRKGASAPREETRA